MSASQDKSQKVAFVFSNLYDIYRKGKSSALASDPEATLEAASLVSPFVANSRVLKHGDLSQGDRPASPAPAIHAFTPIELIGKRVKTPESLLLKAGSNPALDSLKTNLKTLNDLHSRLRFLLQELENLVDES